MHFKIYRSSAGSGKTFTLTKEYLKLALVCPDSPDHFNPYYFRYILAVTFTNDAASEMKKRILDKLEDFAKLEGGMEDFMLQAIEKEIREEYPANPINQQELIRRAGLIHETVLHNYSDFSVSTIDSFNNRVVQSFKKELELPYNYEIELDTEELLHEAVDLLQDEVGIGRQQDLTQILVEFALFKTRDQKSWFIDSDLTDFGKELFNEDRLEAIEALASIPLKDYLAISKKLSAYVAKIDEQVRNVGDKAVKLIESQNLTPKEFYYGSGNIANFFYKLAEVKANWHVGDQYEPKARVLQSINDDKWASGKATEAQKAAIESIATTLTDFFLKISALREKEVNPYLLAVHLRKNIYLMATISELQKQLESIKEERNVVHISDFNRKINQVVEEEPVPFIYEKIGEKYRHILIDEFQDTSKMQWHNLVPLVANSLARGMQSLVVGDAKQAIYRWRGGKAEMLVHLPDIPTALPGSALEMESQIFRQEENIQALNTNFRSRDAIVDFNNHLFRTLCEQLSEDLPALPDYYREVEQNTTGKAGGIVKTYFLEKKNRGDKGAYAEAQFQQTLSIIQNLQEQHYPLSEITILTRNNKEGTYLAEKLIAEQVPVVSRESLLVQNSAPIRFIIDMMRVIMQPRSPMVQTNICLYLDEHFARYRNGYSRKMNGDAFQSISESMSKGSHQNFQELLDQFFGIDFSFTALRDHSVYEIVERLIRTFQLQTLRKEQVYLQRFLNFALDFSNKRNNNLPDFLELWDRKCESLSISPPKSGEAVHIMTIHKSKGLQFSVVILPFAEWSTKARNQEKLWVRPAEDEGLEVPAAILPMNEDLENTHFHDAYRQEFSANFLDAFNMLYVAMTRAVDQLYILGPQKGDLKKKIPSDIGEVVSLYASLAGKRIQEEQTYTIEVKPDLAKETLQVACKELTWHQADTPLPKKEDEQESATLSIKEMTHTQTRDKIRIRRSSLRDSDNEITLADIFSARKQGIFIHEAMEKIQYIEDIPQAVQSLVMAGLIEESETDAMQLRLKRLLSLPPIAPYFQRQEGMRVYNEKEIILKRKKGLKVLRPDRMVVMPEKTVVIDYKTGSEDTDKHTQQIKEYGSVLEKMGYPKVEKYILYTEEANVVTV